MENEDSRIFNNDKKFNIQPKKTGGNRRSPLASFICANNHEFGTERQKFSVTARVGSPGVRSSSIHGLRNLRSNKTESSKPPFGNRKLKSEKDTPDERYLPVIPDSAIPYLHDRIFAADDSCGNHKKVNLDNDADVETKRKFAIIRNSVIDTTGSPRKVLSYSNDLPTSNEAGTGEAVKFQTKSKYSKEEPSWMKRRFIPKTAERILDAPDLENDFYRNVLHWGGNNMIVVGLGDAAYLWNASSGDIIKLGESVSPTNAAIFDHANVPKDNVHSLKWSGNELSSCLAIGRESGGVQLWDVRARKCLRTFREHSSRVCALSWNHHILSTGSQSGNIINHDVRMANSVISKLEGYHTQEVCSLLWSPDGRHIASGGNDNVVQIWNMQQVTSQNEAASKTSACSPLLSFVEHRAAVKALAWHPREVNLIASGGGTSDGRIFFWNIHNGNVVTTIETNSQVSGYVWSSYYNEFITSHGYPHNRLTVWSYPSMSVITHLTGHSQRILSICPSPDGSTIASIGGDETLRLWRCFEVPKSAKKQLSGSKHGKLKNGLTTIR